MTRLALALVATALLASGCNQHQPDQRLSENRSIASQLRSDWRAIPKLDDVKAEYLDSADALNEMKVEVWCSGCDRGEVADRLVRDIWSSKLTPLSTINVSVADEAVDGTVRRNFYVPDQKKQLQATYGDRPEGTSAT